MSKPPRRRPSLLIERLEDRVNPALIGLEAADVPVSATAGDDRGGEVAMRADGTGFVVAYSSPDASGFGVFFKRYDANWQLVQGPVAVNTFTANDQVMPSVDIDGSGNFVIAYESFGQDPGDSAGQSGIYARRYTAAGVAVDAAEFQVNTTTVSQQRTPDVGVNAAGQFTIVYRTGVTVNTVLAQSYASTTGALTPVGGEITVKLGDGGSNNATVPTLALDSSGNYAVTYQLDGLDGGGFGIYAQRRSPAGAVLTAEFQVNTVTAGEQQFPDVAMDGAGNFNIVWYSPGVDGNGTAIVMQRYNASGVAQGGNIQVNTGITTGNQLDPHISATTGGTFLVTWHGEEADLDASGADVYYKTFNSSGGVLIGDTLINLGSASNDQSEINVVSGINTAGDFVIMFDTAAGASFDTVLRRYGEAPVVQFASTGSSPNENSGTSSYTVNRTAAAYVIANVATAVSVTNTGGTAAPGVDFTTAFPQSVTIAAGSTSQSANVALVNDTLFEGNETIVKGIAASANYTIGGTSARTITIVDDDPAPTVSVSSPTVTEGNAGTTTLTFTISLNTASGLAVTGNFATADGTATAGSDYVAVGSTAFSIPAGTTSITRSVTVNGDLLFENNETLLLNLTGITNAGNTTASGTGTINNDDTAPTIAVSSPSVTEGDSGSVNLTFTISLSAASGVNVTGNYATANGTATAGTDYTALGTTAFTISAGATSTTVTVSVTGDTLFETNETLLLNLTGVTGTTNATASGTSTIVDDDAAATISISSGNNQSAVVNAAFAAPLVALVRNANNNPVQGVTVTFTAPAAGASFTPTPISVTTNASGLASSGTITANATAGGPYSVPAAATGGSNPSVNFSLTNLPPVNFTINDVNVTEGNSGTTTLTFTVTASPAPTGTATVDWATASGTATTADSDYVGASGTLTFNAGVTTQTIAITINGDTKFEANETFVVNLSNPTNAAITDNQGVGTIDNDDTAPSLTINDVTVTEGNAGTVTATFTVTQSAVSGVTTTVTAATANDTATAGADYVANAGTTVTFAPGVTTQTFSVTVNGDLLDEVNETFFVNLSGASGASIADAQGVGTITDDDAPPSLSINDVTVTEGDAGTVTATFTVSLSSASGQTITVSAASADGTALTPADYAALAATTLTFAPGVTSQTVSVTVNGDLLDEANETFLVNLTAPTNATIADNQGVGTITDNDPAPSLSINDVTVTEGDAGTVTATFTVTLSAPSGQTVTVSAATADGTAVAPADYVTLGATTLTFAPGVTTQTFSVTVNGDLLDEANETFFVNLTAPTNATIADNQGLGTITDNDPAPSLTINDITAAEGSAGANPFTFTVTLSAVSGQAVTVNYATADGTAGAPSDYAVTTGTLTFAPGVTTQTVTVNVSGDAVFETTETFFVNLSGATNATIADNQGLGTINNDDNAPTLSINDVTVSEAAGTLTFTVTRTGETELAATVDYALAPDTAVSTTGGPGTPDFTAATGTVTFPASLVTTATQTFTVALTNDNVYEAVEQFFANLSGATNATITDSQGLATISNDDAAPTVAIGDITVSENGTATFTVTLTGATALPIAVDYATADGTAVASSAGPGTPDYTTTTGTVSFAASASGSQTMTFTVPLTNDTTNEAAEQFAVNLSNSTNGSTISDAQGVATITDDDPVPSISVNDVTLAEGNAGTTAFVFTVSLSAASAQTVTVNYTTADGTALAGTDYTATSGTLTFAPGETTKTVTVLVTGDTVFEPDQGFTVNLSGPTNATLADGQGDGTITNDDLAPTLTINDVTVSEADGTLTFTVTRTGATEVAVEVDYATTDGTAVSTGSAPGQPDFTAATGTVTITPSLAATATQTFTITLTDDNVYEAVEQFTVDLSNPTGATIADGEGLATIQNDDAAPTIAIGDITVSEDGTATFTVTLTGATALPIAVDYATADGTAVASSAGPGTPDYTTTTGTLTFSPSTLGTQTLTFTVPLNDDTTNEAAEQFVVTLSNSSNGSTISDTQGVATITDDDPPPTVSVNDVTLAEGNSGTTAFDFTVSLSAASAQTVGVAYTTNDGTALAGTDYVPTSGVLVFLPGETTKTVTVLVNGDTVFEADQTFTVDLSPLVNVTAGDGQGVGTITNDDLAPTLTINDVTVSEADGTLIFTVTRTGATEVPLSVDIATTDATAVSATTGPGTPDFTSTTGTVSFAPSLAATETRTFPIAITDDNVYEAVEQFFANLSNPAGATIADGQGLATIQNDDPAPTIAIGDITVSENGTATFTVTLTGATALPIQVDYATADGTAVAAGSATPGTPDYTTTTGTLTFSPSASGTQTLTFTVPLTNDTTNEADEQFVVNLSNSSNGSTISDAQGVATITNDDPLPTVSVNDVTLAEGNAGTTSFTFTVTLSAASAQVVTVDFATADGSALAGSDYVSNIGTLTFAPGVTTQTVTVLVTGDTVFEPDQAFTLSLVNGTNVAPGAQIVGTGTITNDDAPPTLAIDSVTVVEGTGTLTFTVTRTGATEVPITVSYATADGTAAAPGDYTAASGTLTFAPSLAATETQTFTVTIAGDTADELTETFTATLSGATGATIATATGTGTITDDDLPVAVADTATLLEDGSVTAPTVLGNDNAAPGSVVELVGATTPNGTLTLNPDGTFTYAPNADFNGTDTFQYQVRNPAGEVSGAATVTITVTAVNDAPNATLGANVTVGRSPGAVTIPGWATNLSAGPSDESGQTLAFLVGPVSTSPTLTFDVDPAIDPTTGALTFTPTATTFGTVTFTVLVADDGGTANGGQSSRPLGTFTITVTKHATGNDAPVDQSEFPQYSAAPGPGGPGTADVFNPDGSKASSTVPFGAGVGVRAVLADVTGDGTADVIAGTGPGVPGRLLVTDPTTGKVILSDFPFGAGFTGGLFVAAGDVNADGRADLIVSPDASGGGRVVIYDGATGQVVASFLGIDDQKFRGGARVAVGDVNGDGVSDVIVSAGLTGGPRVAVFDGTSLTAGSTPRKLTNDFFAFEESLRDGVYVAVGDLNGDGFGDLIFGGGPGGGARVLARDGKSLFGPGTGGNGAFVSLTSFFAGDSSLRDGVQVAVKNADGDGLADLVTAVRTPNGPEVRLYLGKTLGPGGGPFVTDLDPYPGLLTGIYVG